MRCLALTIALATACSSSYTPQSRGRVSVMMQSGAPVYVRDGRIYEHGFLGGGLEEVVRGNVAAENAADEYTGRLKLGLLGTFGGLACMIAGTSYAASRLDQDGSDAEDNAERALWIALGCSVVTIVSAFYMASAEPYRWDAINLFNDAPPPPGPLMYPPAQGWAPPRTSLKMRD